MTDRVAEACITSLLAERGPGKTICPSEIARRLADPASGDWRAEMPRVHDTVDAMLARKAISLSWKGAGLPARAGPYRIGSGK